MKRRTIIFILAVLLIITSFSCKRNQDDGKTVVREGVGRMEAIWKCLTEKDCYIVRDGNDTLKIDSWLVGFWPFWKEVAVAGHSPDFVLGSSLLRNDNLFLVKGYYIEGINWKYGRKDMPCLYVEEWEPVLPVKRKGESLWESNRNGYDLDDVQKGEYIANIDKTRVGFAGLDLFTYGSLKGTVARVEKKDGRLHWYRYIETQNDDPVSIEKFNDDPIEEIIVTGNSPQEYLSETFLHENNLFILYGELDELHVFHCIDWSFLGLNRQNAENDTNKEKVFHSRYYFDLLDIENGDYYPNGDSPLGAEVRQSP